MKSREGFKAKNEDFDVTLYDDKSYYHLLSNLPPELAHRHILHIESEHLSDEDARIYLEKVAEKRKEAVTVSLISDAHVQEICAGKEHDVFEKIETSVFYSADIGYGQTARVKRFDVQYGEEIIPMAVKFVVTPIPGTVSAATEHDMLREVERIRLLEQIEQSAHLQYVHVPHPYLHHKNEKIQCYAMELIDGVTLHQVIHNQASERVCVALREAFQNIDEEIVYKELEDFFATMHSYCLHNDMKPGNIMADTHGKFYIIDLGRSILVTDIPEEGQGPLQNLKEAEIQKAKNSVKIFLKTLFRKTE